MSNLTIGEGRDIDAIVDAASTGRVVGKIGLKGRPRGRTALDRRIDAKIAAKKLEISRLRAAQSTDSSQ